MNEKLLLLKNSLILLLKYCYQNVLFFGRHFALVQNMREKVSLLKINCSILVFKVFVLVVFDTGFLFVINKMD